MSNLKYRLLLILALCAMSVFWLVPRTVKIQTRGTDGLLHTDTVRRIPLRKGLDLQGGMYLELGPDQSKQVLTKEKLADAIERAVKTVRNRVDGMGVSETSVQTVNNERIVVQIPGVDDEARAEQLVEQQAFLQFMIVDKTDALGKSLARLDQAVKQAGGAAAASAANDSAATASADQAKGLDLLLKQHDTSHKADTGKAAAGKTGAKGLLSAKTKDTANDSSKVQAGGAISSLLNAGEMPGEFLVVADKAPLMRNYLKLPGVMAAFPPGKTMVPGRDSSIRGNVTYKYFYVVDSKAIMTGEGLTGATPKTDPNDGAVVAFTLNNSDGRKFGIETTKHLGDYMAIVLDGMVMGQPPVIRGSIRTSGQITMGGRDISAAQDLALVLRAGALPVPLRVLEVRRIGPTLGEDSIRQGVRAGLIAIALVVAILLGYYRFSGMLAVGGLALYVLYTLAMLAGFDAVLTLPGLAGFVLSIGIAVDSNVLIFERIREEMDRGKTPRTSIEEGFRHAMPAIIDSNVSTILTAAVLYQYGTGPVKGFAVTLIAGIFASLITSIFVVKTFYLMWLNRTRGAQTVSI